MKKRPAEVSQSSLILEYFKNNPKRDIPHRETVAWALKEFTRRTGRVFADPDRGIRKLHQDGILVKVKKGVYRYDPSLVQKRDLEDFSPELKKRILARDGHRCVICGRGKAEGVELHVDHIKPKDFGGKATYENGQTLCAQHNFLKKNFEQTEAGKKFFIRLYNLSRATNATELLKFTREVLEVFEKNKIDEHIEWEK